MNRPRLHRSILIIVQGILWSVAAATADEIPAFTPRPDTSQSRHDQEASPRAHALITKLDETDLRWRVDEAGQVRVDLRNEAAEILRLSPPPFALLQRALDDPQTTVPAHIVLWHILREPGSGILIEPRGYVFFCGLDAKLQPPSAGTPEWIATFPLFRGEAKPTILSICSFAGQTVNEMRNAYALRQKRALSEKPRLGHVTARRRDLVEKIRNDDVVWGVGGSGVVTVFLNTPATVTTGELSIEALVEALDDPNRFIVAHMLLCGEFFDGRLCQTSTPDGFRVAHHGLRIDLTFPRDAEGKWAKAWKADYPDADKQRMRLAKFWSQANVVAPNE